VSHPLSASTGGRSRAGGVSPRALGVVAALLLVLAASPFAMTFAPAADRTLYFKLPVEGARFHWRFLDREAFLSGELTLRILNKGHDQTLVVFRDGKIHEGWYMIGNARPNGGFYFGFASTHRVRTKASDSLVITLKVKTDLLGQGPDSEGVLAAGVWQMTGTYSAVYGGGWNPIDLVVLAGDPPVAYMQCWKGVWPITITKAEGWMGPKPQDESEHFRRLNKRRGTNRDTCGSHI
jgi:hypothetical protein